MICTLNKVIFIHIPKTAGQSIENFFLSRRGFPWEDRAKMLLKPNSTPSAGPPRLAHLTADEYLRYGYIDNSLFNNYFKFAFVRNPWSRLVSEYRYSHQHKYSFKDFLFNFFPQPNDDSYTDGVDHYRHVLPQYRFICGGNDQVLVDFIGRFENLTEDFKQALSLIGISSNFQLQKVNVTKPKSDQSVSIDYREYYDDESRQRVATIYEKDIELLGYKYCDG